MASKVQSSMFDLDVYFIVLLVMVKYGWLHSRGHTKMYASVNTKVHLEIIKTNILNKIYDNYIKKKDL